VDEWTSRARASLLQQRLKHLYESGALAPLLAALRDVNGDVDPGTARAGGRRFALAVEFQEISGGLCRSTPLALFLPAFGGPGGEVGSAAQWFPPRGPA
jgi:hypothetical protein